MVNIKKLNMAILFVQNNDYNSADKIYAELLRENPDNETVLSFWGLYNLKKGLYSKAEKVLERAYNMRRSPSTIAGLAHVKIRLGKYDDAIILYEELFKYDKDGEFIYKSIIHCFDKLQMYNFASAYCKKYLAAHPDSKEALPLATHIYMNSGEYKSAEETCAKCISLYPDNPAIWINAGILQELLYNNEEMAQECYKTSIEKGNKYGYYHLGVSLAKTGRFNEAKECYEKATEFFPNDTDLKVAKAFLYLTQRDFKTGYEYFSQRDLRVIDEHAKRTKTAEELMIGNNKNKTLLIYADEGLGDNIMFSRYLPPFKELFNKVIVYTREPLTEIFKRNFREIEFIDKDFDSIKYDELIFLADLPDYLKFGADKIPSPDGYLNTNEEKVVYYKNNFFNNDKFKVGLCWRAGEMSLRNAIHRTINIDYFKPLLEMNTVEFYSFQKNDIFDAIKKYPQIIDLSDTFKNFDDTLAAMQNLDLMITVDTACAHIAGAGGINTIMLIPYCSDWRWFDNTEKTEWYSSVKILKQQDRQDWYKEVEIITNKLKVTSKNSYF